MNEPTGNLVRLSDLERWAGVSRHTLGTIIGTGALGGSPLWPSGRRFYLREIARHVLLGTPRPLLPFGVEPKPELLRIAAILQWTGLTRDQFLYASAHGIARRRQITPRSKGLYYKAEIRAAFFEPLLPAGWYHSSC